MKPNDTQSATSLKSSRFKLKSHQAYPLPFLFFPSISIVAYTFCVSRMVVFFIYIFIIFLSIITLTFKKKMNKGRGKKNKGRQIHTQAHPCWSLQRSHKRRMVSVNQYQWKDVPIMSTMLVFLALGLLDLLCHRICIFQRLTRHRHHWIGE